MQPAAIGRQQEELPPEALGMLSIVGLGISAGAWHLVGGVTYFEESLVELDDLRLKGLGSTLLGEGRCLHDSRRNDLHVTEAERCFFDVFQHRSPTPEQLGTSHFVSGSSHMSF